MSNLRLDLGSGNTPQLGYDGVDLHCPVRFQFDLLSFPWPLEDSSVEEVISNHFLEHVPGSLRGRFMDEVYRVLRPSGRATFITPYWSSERSIQDFTHEWPPIVHASYRYFDKGWRVACGIDHPPYPTCDFEASPPAYKMEDSHKQRAPDYQAHATTHYINVVEDLTVTLISRKRAPTPADAPPQLPSTT